MPHQISQTLALLYFVITLILIHILNYICADDYHYVNCNKTFDCSGHFNISYPFWGSNQPRYCGHPEFELNCTENFPLITIESVNYRILELNQTQNTLVVARDDYWELSPYPKEFRNTTIGPCPKEFRNTTIGPSVFSFASNSQNLMIYYGCPQFTRDTIYNNATTTVTVNGTSTSAQSTVLASKTVITAAPSVVVSNGTANTPAPSVVVSNGTANTPAPSVVVSNGTSNTPAPSVVVSNGTANTPAPTYVLPNGTANTPAPTYVLPNETAEQTNLFECDKNGEVWVNYLFTEATKESLKGGVNAQTCKGMIILRISNSIVRNTSNTSASLVSALTTGFGLTWKLNVSSSCDECKASGGSCGSNENSSKFTCYCVDGPQTSKCSGSGIPWRRILIGLSVTLLGSIIILIVIIYIIKRKRKETGTFDVEELIRNFGSFAPKRYNYFNVKKITNSFAERIGKGGFGTVYKGKLSDGRLVAVKLLSDSKHNGQDFINEVASIGRCSHVNIVTLLGFCYEKNKRALIYEYMPNGSLDKFIFGHKECLNTNRPLYWTIFYEITVGIARGLEYLHRGCNTGILHFDIKPQNILLDDKLCPKISDFGLAKLWPRKESIVSMVGARGTAGYIAPEVFSRNFGAVSHKSDVYSYGMLVLEIVGGRKNVDGEVSHTSQIYFPHFIYDDIEHDKDLRIEGITNDEDKEIAKKMILVSFWCIQTRPSDRPSMSKVADMLEGSLESLQIPPKPFLYSPKRSPQESTSLALD